MSSSNCSLAPEDDFFRALDKSLNIEYSSQKITKFVADLLVAINNLDDDPEADFIFDDQEYDYSDTYDFFASSGSTYGEPRQMLFRPNEFTSARNVVDISVDMFEDEEEQELIGRNELTSKRQTVDVSVDMFDDQEPTKDADDISVDLFEDESLHEPAPKNDETVSPVIESEDECVDMFAEFHDDNEMDADRDTIILHQQSNVADYQNDEVENSDRVEQMETDGYRNCYDKTNLHEQINVIGHQNKEFEDSDRVEHLNVNERNDTNALLNDSAAVRDKNQLNKSPSVDFLQKSADEAHPKVNEYSRSPVHINQESLQQNVELRGTATADSLVNDELDQSLEVLVRAPSNISDYEPNENERALSAVLESSEIIPRAYSDFACFPVIVPTQGNVCQEWGSLRSRGIPFPINGTANMALLNSSHSTLFEGFLSAASSNVSMASTICEEYETAHNSARRMRRSLSRSTDFGGFAPVPPMTYSVCVIPNNSTTRTRRSLSRSTDFRGFSPVPAIRQAAVDQSSILVKTRSESHLNATLREEYETAINSATQIEQCFVESQAHVSPNARRRQSLIEEIGKFIMKLNDDSVCGRKLAIEVPYTVIRENCGVSNERLCLRPLSNDKTRVISQKQKMALIVYILSFVLKLLLRNETCTKREIYYSNPELTQSQLKVENAILDICLILNARPWEIGILSSSKGLIAGSIKLTLKDDSILDVESIRGGILLPHHTVAIKKVETSAKFVLLVEKHTIYEKLLAIDIPNRLGPCILVTGKGYPDINTRIILKKIWDDCKCPIYALVDADPHGIEIMLTYRHGSVRMALFNDHLAIPSIHWIGVYPSEIQKLDLLSMPLSVEDVNRLDCMLKRPYLCKKVVRQLKALKKSLKKSELEALFSSQKVKSIDLYLSKKIRSGKFM